MNEKPILFSAEMVRAICSGRKTQTRRVIKPQPPSQNCTGFAIDRPIAPDEHWQLAGYTGTWGFRGSDGIALSNSWRCPYGQPDDLLWVRETWCKTPNFGVIYRADSDCDFEDTVFGDYEDPRIKWKPSIFMPRDLSRITLQVKSVRVEQLQAINEDDAKAEGVSVPDVLLAGCTYPNLSYEIDGPHTITGCFRQLWDTINATRGYTWASNPWVWVIEFVTIKA